MLDDLKNKIQALTAFDFMAEQENIVRNNTDAIEKLQIDQWAEGKDRDGNPTSLDGVPAYEPSTIRYKQEHGIGLGAVTDHVTGYQTGALYSGLQVGVDNQELTFQSNVPYFKDLVERTGDIWLGLDKENRETFGQNVIINAIKGVFASKMGFTDEPNFD
jgi:hypothetical protein